MNIHHARADVPAGLVDEERSLARGHDRLTGRTDAERLVVPFVERLARLVEDLDDGEARVARQRERDLLAGGERLGVLEAADERRPGRHEGEGRNAGAQDEVLRTLRGDRPVWVDDKAAAAVAVARVAGMTRRRPQDTEMVPDLVFPPRDVEHALVVHAYEELPVQPNAHGHVAWAETQLDVAPLLILRG